MEKKIRDIKAMCDELAHQNGVLEDYLRNVSTNSRTSDSWIFEQVSENETKITKLSLDIRILHEQNRMKEQRKSNRRKNRLEKQKILDRLELEVVGIENSLKRKRDEVTRVSNQITDIELTMSQIAEDDVQKLRIKKRRIENTIEDLMIKISVFSRQTETTTTMVISRDMKGYVEVPLDVDAEEFFKEKILDTQRKTSRLERQFADSPISPEVKKTVRQPPKTSSRFPYGNKEGSSSSSSSPYKG